MDDQLENGVYSFQYHPELARDPSVNDGKGTLDYVRYAINLAERRNFWIPNQRELYQRMADYEDLVFLRAGRRPRGDGRAIRPTARIEALVVEQRLPFDSVWDGEQEIVHVVRDAFVTVPRLAPGGSVTLRFSAEADRGTDPAQAQQQGAGGPGCPPRPPGGADRSARQRLPCAAAGGGRDQSGRHLPGPGGRRKPPFNVMPRTARTIAALLSKQSSAATANARRTQVPGVTRFLDLMIQGDPDNFVERRLRIRELTGTDERAARAAILAAIPAKTGRVL